jgi:hypothetical protein
MTMHVVLGDGLLPAKELDALLLDLSEKSTEADDPFWFLVQGKAEPTATDTALVTWLIDHDIYYEMISDGSESDLYEGFQNKYTVKRLAPKVVSLMQETPEEGEEAHLLALFAADDPDAEEDRWLNDVIQAVTDAGYTVLAMNDGMQEIRIIQTDEIEPDEEEETPVPSKTTAKKAAVKPHPNAIPGSFSREALEEMDLDGLKEVASKLGISLPPRTRMATYVETILGNAKDEEVEVVAPDEDEADTVQPTFSVTQNGATVVAPAMMIIVYNGTVVSRAISDDEAHAMLSV